MNSKAEPQENYGNLARLLHWLMAAMVVILIAVGLYMTGLDKSDPDKFKLIGLHKSFGAIFLFLAVGRVVWSRISHPPQLPAVLAPWERLLSKAVTASLYLLMLTIPLSGYAMSNLFGQPVSLFGAIELPVLWDKNPELGKLARQAHVLLVYALLAGLVAHVAGALKHRYLDAPEADVLPRMLPIKPRT